MALCNSKNIGWRALMVLLVSVLMRPVLAADESTTETAASDERRAITRIDLAVSYLRFERALEAHPPTSDKLAAVNQAFDRATLAFFARRHAEAIKGINELTDSLVASTTPTATRIVGPAIKVIEHPRVWPYANFTMAIYPHLVGMYPVLLPGAGDQNFRLTIKDETGTILTFLDQPFTIAAGTTTTLDSPIQGMFADDLVSGTYDVEIIGPGDEVFPLMPWYVIPKPFAELRAENEKMLAAVKAETPELVAALATCKARNALLDDKAVETSTALFLADPNQLISDIEKEIAALAEGKNPYRRKTGDYWRVLATDRAPIPMRVFAPPVAAKDDPLPLVIVLHGAGGDENMFMDGYGAGKIKKLAEDRGFIVASPVSNPIGNEGNFARLVEAMSTDYAVDSKRIYVLGHSMGAGVTAGLARKHYEKIRAACCLAGGQFTPEDKLLAPTLVIAAELDMVIPLARLKPAVEKAVQAGLPIEFRIEQGYGHTLVVGAKLAEAVDWLLAHK